MCFFSYTKIILSASETDIPKAGGDIETVVKIMVPGRGERIDVVVEYQSIPVEARGIICVQKVISTLGLLSKVPKRHFAFLLLFPSASLLLSHSIFFFVPPSPLLHSSFRAE